MSDREKDALSYRVAKGSSLSRKCCCLLLLWLTLRMAASLSWSLEHDQRTNETVWGSKVVALAALAAIAIPCYPVPP